MVYTNISKPTGSTYTKPSKPTGSGGAMFMPGMTMGLLIPLTNAVKRNVGNSYTNVSKPTGSTYTDVAKPT